MSVLYHPGKANVIADALSRMTMDSVPHVEEYEKQLVRDVHRLDRFCVRFQDSPNGGFMVHHNSKLSLVVEVKSKQHFDPLLMELKESILSNFNDSFSQGGGVLRYQGRLCVPDVDNLRVQILEEAYYNTTKI